MAIYHANISVVKTSASAKSDYITRQKKYSKKAKEDLLFCESKNLPSWAKDERDFWKTCDEGEKRGTKGRELKIALPNELTQEQQIELAKEIAHEILGDSHAYTMAIHENVGSLSGEKNPHVHILFCEREIDKTREEPTREDYFKRAGKRKDGTFYGGYKKSEKIVKTDRTKWLHEVREKVEQVTNKSLERHGHDERVSCKTLKEQGIEREPQVHLGNKNIATLKKKRDFTEKEKKVFISKHEIYKESFFKKIDLKTKEYQKLYRKYFK